MSAPSSPAPGQASPKVALNALEHFCRLALGAAGADEPTVDAAARAMMHGSRLGIDSHGVQLLNHYVTVLMNGRVNPRPKLRFIGALGGVATLDADHGHGALAAYMAMDHAVFVAQNSGICAVAIRNSSHFGPAGAYALAAAEAGCIGFVTCNSDSFVRLHDGAAPFHGTNPIACAVPAGDEPPWLFDMATSAIPYNRVKLAQSLGTTLPGGAASDADGRDTQISDEVRMLAPLGGVFGYKGAGLAGMAEILSAVLTGMKLSFEAAPMAGPDFSTPRQLGVFVLAINPGAFLDQQDFRDRMKHYLASLRTSASRPAQRCSRPATVIYAVFIGLLIYRKLKRKGFVEALEGGLADVGSVMFLIALSAIFSYGIVLERVPETVSGWILGLTENLSGVIALISIFVLMTGFFIDATILIIMLTPIFLPVVKQLGGDPVHFGMIFIISATIGNFTPPVGAAMYAVCSVMKCPIGDYTRESIPLFLAVALATLLLIAIPEIVLFVPNLIFGG